MFDATRRRFVATLGMFGLAQAGSGRALGRGRDPQEEEDGKKQKKPMKSMMDPLEDRFPRRDPSIAISPPPKLMGRQMGRIQTPGIAPLGYEMDGNVKVFRLIAQPVEKDISAGMSRSQVDQRMTIPKLFQRFRPRPSQPKKMLCWGYNGTTCGPTLEATEGDRVRIIFKNELPEPTSIHWHGFEIPFSEDGATGYFPFEARRPVMPGQTDVYEFDLIQSGTLMYHTGFNVMKQEGMGVSGMFVIHPKKEEQPPDQDFAIMLQQWNFRPGNPHPNIIPMEPTFATFNGLTSPDIPMLKVKQGDRVRIRFGNLSLLYHPIHIHGHIFEIVGTLGGALPKAARMREATVTIGPGETRDIEFVAWNPGTWRMHCHVLHHLMNQMPDQPMGIAPPEGMFTHVQVEPNDPKYDPKDRKAKWSYPSKEERI